MAHVFDLSIVQYASFHLLLLLSTHHVKRLILLLSTIDNVAGAQLRREVFFGDSYALTKDGEGFQEQPRGDKITTQFFLDALPNLRRRGEVAGSIERLARTNFDRCQ